MRILLVLLFAAGVSACTCTQIRNSDSVTHVVMVWFNDSVTQDDIDTVARRTLELRDIPQLVDIKVGKAIPSDRPIVDDSFDLGLVMTFDSVESMNIYVEHPIHVKFVEQYLKGKVDRLVVYDF